ncbi:MAG: hypothetical protein AAB582_01910 [Patescibacteria group bacterium]
MAITSFILRFGNVGGTARWVAKNYLRLNKKGVTDVDVMKEMINIRYAVFKDNSTKNKLLERLSYLDNLTDFTFSILQLEGAMKTGEMPTHLQMQAGATIMQELEKKGIPHTLIVGKSE